MGPLVLKPQWKGLGMSLVALSSWIEIADAVCVGLRVRVTDSAKPSGSQRVVYTCAYSVVLSEQPTPSHPFTFFRGTTKCAVSVHHIPACKGRLFSLTGNHPQHIAYLKAKIQKVGKNASKPAWLVVAKGLRGSSTPRVSLGLHMCVCCRVTMPLVSARTGPSLWSVVELRLLSHFLWLLYFISHNHKHTHSPETALYIYWREWGQTRLF